MLWAAVLLAAATVAAYWPALHAGFVWDDDTFLTANDLIKSVHGLYRFWFTRDAPDYWPVTSTSLWLEWRLWGLNATGYHVTNVLLHVAESLLLWRLLRRLNIPGAYLAAFLFALHPINVESVAWITQRKNLMAMLFFLLSIDRFAAWLDSGSGVSPLPSGSRSTRPYWLSLTFFTLALLSKGSVAPLPLVLAGLLLWRRQRLWGRAAAALAPFFLAAAVFTLVDIWFQHHGASEAIRVASPLERVLGAGAIFWFYLAKCLVPVGLEFMYPLWRIRADDPAWWLPLLGAMAVTLVLWAARKRGTRPALYAWGYFAVMLIPVLGFTDVFYMRFSLVADHYVHLALIAVPAGIGGAWAMAGARWPGLRPGLGLLAAAVLAAFGADTWHQCLKYRDAETLYRTILRDNPASWLAHTNLSLVLTDSGRTDEGVAQAETAARMKPGEPEVQYDLGRALARAGRLDEAIQHYRSALELRPNYPSAHMNLANALARQGKLDQAEAEYAAAIRDRPGYFDAELNLGNVLALEGRLDDAAALLGSLIPEHADDADLRNDYGTVLAEQGKLEAARDQFGEAVRLRPDFTEARTNLDHVTADLRRASP